VSRAGRSLPPEKTWYSLYTTGIRFPERPARSQSLHRLRYPALDMSLASQGIPPCFVEYEDLFPHSKAASNCPYPEPEGSKLRKIQYTVFFDR
jgi:hypothetical protein